MSSPPGTSERLTFQDVSSLLVRLGVREAASELASFRLEPFSSGRLGYMGMHEQLRVETRSGTSLGFFVKSMTPGAIDFDELVFREESAFLDRTAPQLLSGFRAERWAAECYLARPGLLLMEDLRRTGFRAINRPLGERELRAGLATLARFHASSMLLEAQLGRGLDQLYPGLFRAKVLRDEMASSRIWLATGMDVVEMLARGLGLDTRNIKLGYQLAMQRVLPVSGERNVLCHCDLWFNNMMFDETGTRCRLVDFQMVTYAHYAVDLAQMIHMNARLETRRESEAELIQVYHSALEECLRMHDYAGPVVSLEELTRDLEEKRICGLVSAVQILPIGLWPDEVSDEYVHPDKCLYYRNTSRKELVAKAMQLDEDYKSWMEEMVREFLEYIENFQA